MTTLRVILGDQLSRDLPALAGIEAGDVVLMAEVMSECTYVRHHPKKIVLVLSGMRHFAAELEALGIVTRYVKLDDEDNTGSLMGEVRRAVREIGPDRIVVTEAGEWRVRQDILSWQAAVGVPVTMLDDTRFCAPPGFFAAWAKGRRELRMEFFYREMRRLHGLLMEGDAPEGGRWNYDAENRKRLPKGVSPPPAQRFPPDAVTREVMALVAARFADHYGSVEGFDLPVCAADAQAGLEDFIAARLRGFGDWQDAMALDEPYLFHGLVSAPLNLGLLNPLAVCRAAEAAYRDGSAPLNAVEGFVRQILGWREFVRGIYWLHMPEYGETNALGATLPLPEFYWTGETKMRCMATAIRQTMENAYAHHIQRLMITGNFALIAGLHPDGVDDWYMCVYADAYQWVEMPNTRGMALHADGGIIGSKPYAHAGAYTNRMSDYCGGCHYSVKDTLGEKACPFNALYWDFIGRHAERFEANPRMDLPVRNWRNMPLDKRRAIFARAEDLRAGIEAL